jgi:hypothetical protein
VPMDRVMSWMCASQAHPKSAGRESQGVFLMAMKKATRKKGARKGARKAKGARKKGARKAKRGRK